MTTKELIQDFLKLQKAYSFTKRKLVTAERYVHIAQTGLVDKKDYNNEVLREPLVEHVGHLPILASYFYPHIEHKEKVDLGRALVMLSIHDIGETVTGDIFAYSKTDQHAHDEYHEALRVLHPSLHTYLDEFEANDTWDAKYAKAIDVLAPNIHEVNMPHITIDRFKQLNFTVNDAIINRRKWVEWDSVLLEAYDLVMEQYAHIEDGKEPVFKPEPYDVL